MRHSPPARRANLRPVPRRSLKLGIWSLLVTLLILAWMLLPYIQRW